MAAGGLLGSGAHFANVIPDVEQDLANGVRGLPQRLGAPSSGIVCAVLMIAASLVLALGPGRPGALSIAGLAVVAVVISAGVLSGLRRRSSRVAFRLALVVAGLDVAMLVAHGHSLH